MRPLQPALHPHFISSSMALEQGVQDTLLKYNIHLLIDAIHSVQLTEALDSL